MPAALPVRMFVYYRVAADSQGAREAVAALIGAVRSATGVAGELLARCDDAATWMEIYEPVADAESFRRQLAELAQRHRVAALAIDGGRHVECFAALRPLPSTADDQGADAR